MSHELVAFPNGSFSVKPLRSLLGHEEAMHSHIGPWQEAELIYVGQADLAGRLSQLGEPLVVFDLGMGIAANALAALERFSECAPRRELHLISFEKHLDGLRLALSRSECFPWVARYRERLETLLEKGLWSAPGVRWELREGDFLSADLQALAETSPAEVVFFDFYSPKACPELWSVECFEKIRSAATSRAELFTYSASTAARAAMLLAGWNVGEGLPTSAKSETTVAAAFLPDLKRPLGPEWLAKLLRSEKPLPLDVTPAQRERALEQIAHHPTFYRRASHGSL